MIYFTLKEIGKKTEGVQQFIDYVADNAYCITLAVSLGQVKTLIENPYSMTHSAYNPGRNKRSLRNSFGLVEPGGLRLSIGLEHPDDIIADLDRALQHRTGNRKNCGNSPQLVGSSRKNPVGFL
jgi:methionine-gamma-lyase